MLFNAICYNKIILPHEPNLSIAPPGSVLDGALTNKGQGNGRFAHMTISPETFRCSFRGNVIELPDAAHANHLKQRKEEDGFRLQGDKPPTPDRQ